AIPAEIMVRPVAIAFTVGLVVLAVVGNEIIEREAVVAGDEVDALLRFALFAPVHVRASTEPEPPGAGHPIVAFEKRPEIVAEPPVPVLPAIADETADLIQPGGVPSFGDQLDIGEDRIGFDVPEDRRRSHRAAGFVTRQYRGEVKTKAVDMHLIDP